MTQIVNHAGKALTDLPIVDRNTIDILKQSPSQNAIKGCFLFKFRQCKAILYCQIRQTTIPQDNCWLSCDHTSYTVANIGLFREDGVWRTQYEGLFCVLNSDGEVMTCTATKSLSFDNVQENCKKAHRSLQSLQKGSHIKANMWKSF